MDHRCAHAVNIHGCVYKASLTTVNMTESSGGGPGGSPTSGKLANIQNVACIFCAAPLPHPSAPFCNHCGSPQKKCINSQCQAPLSSSVPMCYYCGTPQQSQQQSDKKCINPQCGALLLHSMYCTTCGSSQDTVKLQQFLSAAHCISCSATLLLPGQKVCHCCGIPQSTQTSMGHKEQQSPPQVHCISCSAKLLHPGQMVCHCCGIPLSTQTSMGHKKQQSLPQVHCISCSAKLLRPGQKTCHHCGAAQSTQTSMIHKEQLSLPHVSQPSHSHVLNPSQTTLFSHQVTPNHACADADVLHSHLPTTSRSPRVPKPTLHPHSVQSSVSPTHSTAHHQNVYSAARCSPAVSDTISISKRSKLKVRAFRQHLKFNIY